MTTSYLTEIDRRWLARQIVKVAEKLIEQLLRRWTSDGKVDGVVKVEAHWRDDAAFTR